MAVVEFRYADQNGTAIFGAKKESAEKVALLRQSLDEFEKEANEKKSTLSFPWRDILFSAETLKKAFIIHDEDGADDAFDGLVIGNIPPVESFCRWWRDYKEALAEAEKKKEKEKKELARPRHHSLFDPWGFWDIDKWQKEIDDIITSYAQEVRKTEPDPNEKFSATISINGDTHHFKNKADFIDYIFGIRGLE